MALFGAVGEYVEGEEDWSQYVERLGHFFGANGVSDASKKRSVLLSTIGPKAYQTLASLVAPETPGGKTYDELIKLMAEHLSPKPPVIVQRYRFHSRVRQLGESVSVYVTQLKELARKCEFGDALNDMLRDRLVCGINDERVQKRLLVEVNLTFDSALKISQGCEVAERCAKEIHSGRSQELAEHQNQQIHAVTPGRPQWRTGPGTGTPRCYRCLRRDHAPDKCPHRSAECFGCGKRGHIRRACKQVSIDGVLVTMELDTGAAVSIVSESTFRRLWIDWKSLFGIQKGASLENVLTKYEMVFNEGLGTVLGYEAKLVMKENAVPRFCKARHIHLNKDKCFFLQESVVYLGYKIDKNGIHPLAEKVEAVKNAPEPKNITELKSYLGLLTYYSRFLPHMATMLAQLYRLLQAKIPWNWTQKEKMAFENSKNLLLSAKVLVHFDPNKELILACDASSYGVGAVLSHKMSDGTERPIAFASRTLSSAEKNYSQLEKEGLACIFGVKRFHLYLYGRNFTIVTDHKPLLQLFDPQRGIPMQVSGRIQRWIMTLAVYKYKLVFKKTEEHGNADALSRLPMDGKQIEEEEEIPTELVLLFESLKDSPVDCSQVKHWTKKDPILSQVLQYILAGWPLHPPSGASQTLLSFWQRRMELSTHDGCILWGNRVVFPEKGRNYVLQELHGGHPGISRMKSLSRTFVWWPGIDKDIEMLVSKCPQCQAARPSPPVAPLQPWSWPTRPWARLHIDYAGPVEGQMLLVVIDAHSKWIEVEVGKDATAEATIQRLRTIFSRSAPHHPSSNGMAERAVQTVKQGVKKMTTVTLRDKLARFLFQYRITPQTTTGVSPAELLRHQDQLRKRAGEADDTWMGDRLSTDVAAEDPELNNGAQDEQEEDANNSVVGDEPEIDEEIDQEARPPVIVQQAPDRRYPSRNRRQPERYQAGFS
eukprot:Em0016g1140a